MSKQHPQLTVDNYHQDNTMDSDLSSDDADDLRPATPPLSQEEDPLSSHDSMDISTLNLPPPALPQPLQTQHYARPLIRAGGVPLTGARLSSLAMPQNRLRDSFEQRPTSVSTMSQSSVMSRTRQLRRKDWVFTIHPSWEMGVGEDVEERLRNTYTTLTTRMQSLHPAVVKFLAMQVENTRDGYAHIQGYIELQQTVTPDEIKNILGHSDAHVEQRRAARDNAIKYCQKIYSRRPGFEPVEIGQVQGEQGKRSDIDRVIEDINNGCAAQEICANHPKAYLRYHAGVNRSCQQRDYIRAPDLRNVSTTVFFGPTGTGKTRAVKAVAPEVYIVDGSLSGPSGSGVWFDGYTTQDAIVLDDYDSWFPTSTLLRYLDRYKLQLPQKGTTAYAYWTRVFITSNVPPVKWTSTTKGALPKPEHKYALLRRLTNVYELHEDITFIYKFRGKCTKLGYKKGYNHVHKRPKEEEEDDEVISIGVVSDDEEKEDQA